MSNDRDRPNSLADLYPRSSDPQILQQCLIDHARRHEMQLQTNIAHSSRIAAVDDRVTEVKQDLKSDVLDLRSEDKEQDRTLHAIQLQITEATGKVRGAFWAMNIVWIVLTAMLGLALKFL